MRYGLDGCGEPLFMLSVEDDTIYMHGKYIQQGRLKRRAAAERNQSFQGG
jgi:hypothetical protein